jgi:Pvc16 N-terminal domain
VIFDLSAVTDTLKNLVTTAWQNAPLWTPTTPQFAVDVTGLSPDAARLGHGTQLSLYLYHIDENNATESLFWTAQAQAAGGPPLQYQPLALDLYYLLSAYAEGNYIQEQQAMSVAMRVFHENPVIRGVGPDGLQWELTLSLERRSYDELSRLWQATTSSLRLSAVYRAAVVLIEPEQPPAPAPPVSIVDLSVEPGVAARVPQLLGIQRDVHYTVPGGAAVDFVQDPATVAAGGSVMLVGTGLDTMTQAQLILIGPPPGNTETDVTTWLVAPPQPPPATLRTVSLPAATGTPAAGAPSPGRYSVRLDGTSSLGTFSTTPVPFSVAPGVSAAGGPLLPHSTTGYTVTGTGFAATDLQVLVGTVPLQPSAAPAAGEFSVSTQGTSLTLVPPAGLLPGNYQIRVRGAGIEADPALWLAAP